MTNLFNEIQEAGINNSEIVNTIKHSDTIDPMSKATTLSRTVSERAKAFKKEYGDVYTPKALKEGIQAIYDEEKAKALQEIEAENTSFQEKRNRVLEIAKNELAKSEDVSTDEISKRVYHAQNMQSELSIELMNANNGGAVHHIINEKLSLAKRDKMTARALLTNMHLFTSKLQELPEVDQAHLKATLYSTQQQLKGLVNGSKVEAYKKIIETFEKQDTNIYQASKLSINMNPNIERYL